MTKTVERKTFGGAETTLKNLNYAGYLSGRLPQRVAVSLQGVKTYSPSFVVGSNSYDTLEDNRKRVLDETQAEFRNGEIGLYGDLSGQFAAAVKRTVENAVELNCVDAAGDVLNMAKTLESQVITLGDLFDYVADVSFRSVSSLRKANISSQSYHEQRMKVADAQDATAGALRVIKNNISFLSSAPK